MRRTPGWISLASTGLEIAALAFASAAMEMGRSKSSAPRGAARPAPQAAAASPPAASTPPAAATPPPTEPATTPRGFLTEIQDEGARYYRASDATTELLAGMYSDGRIRLADAAGRRFAGALRGAHAHVIDLATSEWSEVVLRATPTGRMQLELRGGPFDAHVLTCEVLHA